MDTSGLNINAVGTAIRGMTGWEPNGTVVPSQANMALASFVLPGSYVRMGLRTTDGAPDWAESPAALIDLYEAGFKINPGTGAAKVSQTFAQFDDTLRKAVRGVTPVNGVIDVDIDATPFGILFTEDVYRMQDGSFRILRKAAPATCSSVKTAKGARGSILGTSVEWDVERSEAMGNKHFREAWLNADTAPDPMVWSVAPSGLTVGGQMVIHGINFTGTTAVTIGGTAVVTKSVPDDGTILATIPAGVTAGSKDIIITSPNGVSTAFAYTVS